MIKSHCVVQVEAFLRILKTMPQTYDQFVYPNSIIALRHVCPAKMAVTENGNSVSHNKTDTSAIKPKFFSKVRTDKYMRYTVKCF